jgi:FeS assembly SUF system regulator
MLKISKLADYACSIMRYLASHQESAPSAVQVAKDTRITLPTVRKILKKLHAAHLLLSTRGKEGGYQLARELVEISIADIVEAIDGKIALTSCCAKEINCHRHEVCSMKPEWQNINQIVFHTLSQVNLQQLTGRGG